VRAGRRLVLLLTLLAIGGVVLVGLPPAVTGPLLDVPGAGAGDEVGHGGGWPSQSGGVGRHRLRSVSTAPTRPRLGDEGTDAAVEPVTGHRAVLRLDDVGPEALAAVRTLPGVAHAAAVDVAEVAIAGGAQLTVGLVTAEEFRPLTPRLTAESPEVWRVLADGALLLSPDRAAELGVRAGGTLRRRLAADLRVGGSASNGAPPLVDAIAAAELVDLGTTSRTILIAAEPEVAVPELAGDIATAIAVEPTAMPPAEPRTARLVGSDPDTVAAFAPFSYVEAEGGRIAIDPAWEEANIVHAEVPILGTVRCHRLLLPQLRAALGTLADADLGHLLDPGDYGGCYLPRHIDWSPAASLSMHAWGIAFDVNVSTNGLGAQPQLDPRVVEVFQAHGFTWGGDWRRPDGMHFELARLLDDRELAALRP
jgi:hypothetical protein